MTPAALPSRALRESSRSRDAKISPRFKSPSQEIVRRSKAERLLQVENAFAHQNTGLQLRRINRLGQIVICSSFHRGKQILLAILASQHDSVNVTAVFAEGPDPAAELDALDARQDPVKDR